MKFEIGKKYVTRCGVVVTLIAITLDGALWFQRDDDDECYGTDKNGYYYIEKGEHRLDIMAEHDPRHDKSWREVVEEALRPLELSIKESSSHATVTITPAAPVADPVNHPPHYKSHPSGIECIQITEHMNFCLGNTIKYLWRAGLKQDALEDLKKARWYLDREIARLEGAQGPAPGSYKPVESAK